MFKYFSLESRLERAEKKYKKLLAESQLVVAKEFEKSNSEFIKSVEEQDLSLSKPNVLENISNLNDLAVTTPNLDLETLTPPVQPKPIDPALNEIILTRKKEFQKDVEKKSKKNKKSK
jgi:hypothetical protein